MVSTGGKAYDAVKASNLTIDTGKAITILPQFVGKDSDNDGIPDLVETYGLKSDGTPINSDPNLKDTDGDGLSDNEELGFVPFDAVLHASGEYLQHISYRSDPNNPDTDGDGYIDSLDNNPLIVITAEEIMLMEFCSNAEFHELEFLFGGPSGQNKGFLKWYPNIIDRVRLIEIFRKHAYSPDRVAYYKDLQDAGFMGELEPNFWGQVIHHGADLMLANYELSEGGLSLAQLTWLGYESWTNDIKMAASIWLFGISDRYCRQMATWDYTYEYKLSLQQEQKTKQYIEINGANGKNFGKDELVVSDPKFLNEDGSIKWEEYAPNGGYVEGTKTNGQTICAGSYIDRYGNSQGRYVSPVGTTYGERSLPYIENPNAYHQYYVVKDITNVSMGEIAPAFGQIGGGIQYQLPDSIQNLIAQGVLKEVL